MNITKNSAQHLLLLLLKVVPVVFLCIMLAVKSTTFIGFASYLPTFSFTTTITNYLSTIGISLGDFGVLACGYFNYLVMLHLIECLAEVVLFLPHLFIDFFQKMSK